MADPITATAVLAVLDDFDWDAWVATLDAVYQPIARDIVVTSGSRTFDAFTLDDPFTAEWFTDYVGARIVQLNETTKADVAALIRRAVAEGEAPSPMAMATQIRDLVRDKFDQDYETWRAMRIARTETGTVYGAGTVLGLKQAGVERVHVTDGTDDPGCAAANGSVWTVAYALDHLLEHPNCTRAFSASFD